MAPFLVPLFLAVLLVVIFHPLHLRVLQWCGGRHRLASAVTTSMVILIVLLPLLVVLFMAAAQGSAMVARLNPTRTARQGGPRPRPVFTAENAARRCDSSHRAAHRGARYSHRGTDPECQCAAVRSPESSTMWTACGRRTRSRRSRRVPSSMRCGNRSCRHRTRQTARISARTITMRCALRQAGFTMLKLELLGGEFRMWVKEMANPTEEDLQQRFPLVPGRSQELAVLCQRPHHGTRRKDHHWPDHHDRGHLLLSRRRTQDGGDHHAAVALG